MKPRKTPTTSKPQPPSPVMRKSSEGRGGKAPGLSADARIAVRAYELYEQRGRKMAMPSRTGFRLSGRS